MLEDLGFDEKVSQALLVREPGVIQHLQQLHLPFQEGEAVKVVNLVPIAVYSGKLLVAAPGASWHKKPAKRALPAGALSKAVAVEVAAASVEEPDAVLHSQVLRVWIGFLDAQLVPLLEEEEELDADMSLRHVTEDGETELLPSAQALVEVAEEHFAFQSANEQRKPPSPAAAASQAKDRMSQIETQLQEVQRGLQELLGRPAAAGQRAPAERPAEVGKGRTQAKPAIPGLDPGVLASAREAGIPEDQLVKLGKLVAKKGAVGDAPAPKIKRGPQKRLNVLSETEDEEAVEEDGLEELLEGDAEQDAAGPPLEKAIVQLTKIVGSLAKPRQPKDLETLLDGADADSSEANATSAGKSKASLYKKLKKCLEENPAFLYQTVESQMDLDFNQVRTMPGSSQQPVSSRAWLEHRSRIMNFPTTIRFCWILAGIHDCLKRGEVKQARARAALGLAAADQTSLDSGSWTLSQEALLEDAPPLQAFQNRRAPDRWDQSATKLLDDTWLEILMWKIKSKDAYIESRKRLGPSSGPRADAGKPQPAAAPKKGAKGGKGEKGSGKGRSEAAEGPPQSTSAEK